MATLRFSKSSSFHSDPSKSPSFRAERSYGVALGAMLDYPNYYRSREWPQAMNYSKLRKIYCSSLFFKMLGNKKSHDELFLHPALTLKPSHRVILIRSKTRVVNSKSSGTSNTIKVSCPNREPRNCLARARV